jgi:hypothetical protein
MSKYHRVLEPMRLTFGYVGKAQIRAPKCFSIPSIARAGIAGEAHE